MLSLNTLFLFSLGALLLSVFSLPEKEQGHVLGESVSVGTESEQDLSALRGVVEAMEEENE